MNPMAAASNHAQAGTPEDAGRPDLLEYVKKAVETLFEGALLSKRSEEFGSFCSSFAPAPAAPPSSLLELAERGDGENMLRVLADEQMDILSPPRTKSGDTPLHVAAGGGHLKAVMALLGAGASLDVLGHRLRTPLHCAAAHGHLQVARRLLCAGAKVDVKDADGATALCLATGKGYSEIVGSLLERGGQVDGELASLALSNGSKVLVQLFLEKGLSADACNEGEPLLVHAAKVERWDVVEVLLERGASPTKCKEDRECALVYASKGGQADAVRHLLRRGAASNAEQVKFALFEAPSAAVVWAFVDVVPDQVRGVAGVWGLVLAGQDGRLGKLVALLEAGVDVNSKDGSNNTCLHLASSNGHVECVMELLGRGAEVDAKDNGGSTPLHCAAVNSHVECVRALVGAGASAAVTNFSGITPRALAKTDDVRKALNW